MVAADFSFVVVDAVVASFFGASLHFHVVPSSVVFGRFDVDSFLPCFGILS